MKNKNQILIHILIISLGLTFSSCKKDDCEAGTGGNLTLVGFPKHHDTPIPNLPNYPDTVFLKFNTQEFPGENPSDFDIFFTGIPGDADVHCHGLKCGDYYLYAVGLDTNINQRVKGGIPYTITVESGEVDVDIPVVE